MKAFIIFRDRVTYGARCALALQKAGLDVCVVDHGSTWKPALEWLEILELGGVQVLRKEGGHPRELWAWEPFRAACGSERYIVTDPDVVPDEECPGDWVHRLEEVLDKSEYPKVGLSLRLDRIPESYLHREHVLSWERQFWQDTTQVGDYTVYRAPVDTTLALYQPLAEHTGFSIEGLRMGPPYIAEHLAWYEDLDNLSPELQYYHENAQPGISFWTLEGRSAWNS